METDSGFALRRNVKRLSVSEAGVSGLTSLQQHLLISPHYFLINESIHFRHTECFVEQIVLSPLPSVQNEP
jgi:hypothetical protein